MPAHQRDKIGNDAAPPGSSGSKSLPAPKLEWRDGRLVAPADLWLTYHRDRLVAKGDAEATFLFARGGGEVSTADARRYGLSVPKRKGA